MENAFEIVMPERIGLPNQILEIMKPVHQDCGGIIVIGQSSPQDKGNFTIVCRGCGMRAPMNRKQRLDLIFALLKGKKKEINGRIVVVAPAGG
jgi:hypothetical protein